jgi:predicted DNA-binding protein
MPAHVNEKVAALPSPTMASPTATIRIPKETRDRLAVLADERGVSLSVLLTEWAQGASTEAELEEVFRSEREATRIETENPELLIDDWVWEAAPGGGT